MACVSREKLPVFEYRLVIGERKDKQEGETKYLYPEGTDQENVNASLYFSINYIRLNFSWQNEQLLFTTQATICKSRTLKRFRVCNLVLWENAEHAMVGFKFGKLKKTER
jgi:hypothetical protein